MDTIFGATSVQLAPQHALVALLTADNPALRAQVDELIEQLDATLGSSEIFAALFELELAGRVRQLPGKNYVRAF